MSTTFKPPKYCLHSASGRAFSTWKGFRTYFGKYGTPESQEKYDQYVEKLRRLLDPTGVLTTSVERLVLEYLRYAKIYYRDEEGQQTSEFNCYQQALKPLVRMFGSEPASTFGPRKLQRLQNHLACRYVRTTANRHLSRIKRVFKWGVAQELCPASTADALSYVEGLKAGRSEAREPKPVKSVSIDTVNQTLPELPTVVRNMVRLQLKCGARPSEIRLMRVCEINRTGDVWVYRPSRHKNSHRGKDRVIQIGPQGQRILNAALSGKSNDDFVFTPDGKQTPYTMPAYRRVITRACDRAQIERWTPNQLRHTAASELLKNYDMETARCVLGHSTTRTTEVYAETDLSRAAHAMMEIG